MAINKIFQSIIMFVFNIHKHKHCKESEKTNQILASLSLIIQNQITIMAAIDDLKTEVADLKVKQAELQAAVDLEQEQIAALLATNLQVVQTLNEKIATLEAELAASPNPAAIQEVITDLKAVKDSLATTKADIEGTV